jgi:predicted house-cleaning noncanonical NTP pyrophosphatase (MazG superfamily)
MFQKFFKLRQVRRLALRVITAPGFQVRDAGYIGCHLCRENTYSIHTTYEKASLMGERFSFLSQAIAYMCARCGHVARYADTSGEKVFVNDWSPDKLSIGFEHERKQKAESSGGNVKLVRDKVPALAEAKGDPMRTRKARPDELMRLLKNKLLEEATELAETSDDSYEAYEEMADVLEVIGNLMQQFDAPRLVNVSRCKAEARGIINDVVWEDG